MKPQELPYGAIVPGAQPVSAFIQPGQKNLARPSQPSQLSNPKGIQTIQQGGTTFVQGSNSFKDLANQLKPFSEQLMTAATTAGLAYAGWQIEKGEQAALEQASEAQARLDEETETSELNRAAANRKVASEDPQAGFLMDVLNPYRQIGWKRGRSKLAGQAISMGMAPYVESRASEIDYTSPDQGFAALQRVRADFINGTLSEYGVDRSSPGFTKYVAPKIEQASDAVAQTLQKDRIKWLNDKKPKTLAELVLTTYRDVQKAGAVTFNGRTYRMGEIGFSEALSARLNQVANAELLTAGLPGQSAQWRKDAFGIIAAEQEMKGGTGNVLELLTTNVVKKGSDGKPLKDANGNPRYYSWAELYRQEDLDAQIKYGQARYTQNKNVRTELQKQLQGQLMQQTAGMPAGPERYAKGKAIVEQFIADNGITDPGTMAYLYDAWKEANSSTLSLDRGRLQPEVAGDFVATVNAQYGANFNAAELRQQLARRLSQLQPGSPEYVDLQAKGEAAIKAKEEAEDVEKNYGTTYKPIISLEVQGLVAKEYTNNRKGKRDLAESRYRAVVTPRIQDAIRAEEASLGRRLNRGEVDKITRDVLKGLSEDEKNAIFSDGKSVKAQTQSNAGSGGSGGTKPQSIPVVPTYTMSQLGDIPNRKVVLRKYRNTPILDSSAIEMTILRAINGQEIPKAMRRAWRDANAPSLFDFIEAQYQLLKQRAPDYSPPWPPAAWKQFRNSTLRSAGVERSLYAHLNQVEARPRLAALQGWLVPTMFEV